jgi:lipopolysaccharide/colanic/teichoic acid biosynthesis glycosyltransferase
MKRTVDIAAAAIALLVLLPVLLVVAAAVKLDSAGPVLFRQVRVGRRFRPFFIYKFRTMVVGADCRGPAITSSCDARITRLGRVLRLTKIDELPQLLNVLKGQMSLVGPRPEVPKYVEMFRDDFAEILQARPGLTDLASLKYRNEAETLAQAAQPEREYVTRILPDKIALSKEYLQRASLAFDVMLIARTLAVVVEGSWPGLSRRRSAG